MNTRRLAHWILLALLAAVPNVFASEHDDGQRTLPRRNVGIAERAAWTTSRITGSPEPPPPYRTVQAAQLAFDRPVEMAALPGTDWLLILEQHGKLRAFRNRPDANQSVLVLDLTPLAPAFYSAYGLAFHPKFAENQTCYISYVLKSGKPEGSRVSRFKLASLDPPRIDPASEEIVVTWRSGGHNGACLQFGPDGMLYVSTGDGSPPFPPDMHDTGQNLDDLLACVLRLDVDQREGDRPYAIPRDNPFVEVSGARGEIWAYGFRNPWKMSFDPRSGDLWVGDVGWEMFEMIYRVERGGNYGWSVKEGSQPVLGERRRGPTPILPPTVEHTHVESRSITGGYIYTGTRMPELVGAYVYGDYVTGKVWALRHDGRQVTWQQELCDTPLAIVAFGVDRTGELYLIDFAGTLHRLEPNDSAATNKQFPTRLSETGLFASTAANRPAPGVIGYSINAAAWSDGATAQRWLALPGVSRLGAYDKDNVQIGHIKGEWRFPADGVLAKTISLETEPGNAASRRRIETQVLHYDGSDWRAYSYVWNDEQTDATLAPAEGLDRTLTIADPAAAGGRRQQTWHIAARSECLLCHTTRAGSIHAFNPSQLAKDHVYDDIVADQMQTFSHLGLFEQPPQSRPPLVDPYRDDADLAQRARAYLHVNCAHCHRRGGGGTAAFDARLELPLDKSALVGSRPTQGTFGIHGAQVVFPGDPSRSILFYRMAKLGRGHMPHFGSQVIDERGLKLIAAWIESLGSQAKPPAELTELIARQSADTQQTALIDKLLGTTSGALAALCAVEAGTIGVPARDAVIARAIAHVEPTVRDLFERFVPEDQRSRQLTSKPAEILAISGDAGRGARLFFETAGVTCKNCHRAGGKGAEVGPDLSQIGRQRTRAQLLESILEPSKAIDPKFVTYLVETSEGQVHQGLLIEQTGDAVVLKDAQNRLARIATGDVEQFAPQRTSLMPELLLRDWQPQQVADLLEFLAALK